MEPASSTPARDALSVSVVIPTRNRSALLEQTLRSMLWQREVGFEVIVVDDGSTDGTAQAVADLDDARIRVVRHEASQGVSAARNRGLEKARGEWVAFCDDDDLWAPGKLAAQLAAADRSGAGWVYAGAVHVNERGRVCGGIPPLPPEELVRELRRWDPVPGGCSNVAVRRHLLLGAGGFDTALGTLADWDLWLRLASSGRPAVAPAPLVAYRVHDANMSLDVDRTLAELDVFESRHGLAADRCGFDRYLARQSLRAGQRRRALRLLARAALVDRDGYGRAAFAEDLRLLADHVGDRARARLPTGVRATASARRHRRDRDRDPNRDWKAEAQAWLDALGEPPDRSTSSSTQA